MLLHLTASLRTLDSFGPHPMYQPIVYLTGSMVCVMVALRLLGQALSPLATLMRAITAAVAAAIAVTVGLVILVVAVLATLH